jgi:hypothetical protein
MIKFGITSHKKSGSGGKSSIMDLCLSLDNLYTIGWPISITYARQYVYIMYIFACLSKRKWNTIRTVYQKCSQIFKSKSYIETIHVIRRTCVASCCKVPTVYKNLLSSLLSVLNKKCPQYTSNELVRSLVCDISSIGKARVRPVLWSKMLLSLLPTTRWSADILPT